MAIQADRIQPRLSLKLAGLFLQGDCPVSSIEPTSINLLYPRVFKELGYMRFDVALRLYIPGLHCVCLQKGICLEKIYSARKAEELK
jgi:hypothetical protein